MVFNPPSLCKLSVEIVKKDHLNHNATINFFTNPPPYWIKKWDIVTSNNKLEVVKSQLLLEIEGYFAEEFYSANPPPY